MFNSFLTTPPDFGIIIALGRHVDHVPLLYFAAALVERFWRRHMWMVYVGLAVAAIMLPRP